MRIERPAAPLRAKSGWLCSALAAGLFGGPASAALKLDTHLSEEVEYDSNIFRVSAATAEQLLGIRRRADYISDSQAGAAIEYGIEQQRLYASGDVDRFLYQHQTGLDHNEFQWLAGIDWKLGNAVDGSAQYKSARLMVPEDERAIPSTSLDMETERGGGGGVNVLVAPQWRVESRVDWTQQNSPSADALFHLDQTEYTLAGKYLGLGRINTGLQFQYITGASSDAAENGPFRQYNIDYTLNYKNGTVSQLTVLLGGSSYRYREGREVSSSGFTGQINYKYAVSGKTSVSVDFSRVVQSYPVLSEDVVETGGDVGADWKATSKIFVNLLASYTGYSFTLDSREDRLALIELGLNYQALTWFSLKPTVQYENRRSNQDFYSFADVAAGLKAKLQF